jgi:arabinan endo-1,5-alpha-L-arabinosidase
MPLLWKDEWPVAGENLTPGTYEIQSERGGGALELAIDFVRMPFDVRRSFMAAHSDPVAPIPNQSLAENQQTWPEGNIEVDLGDYMIRAHQQWTITPAPGAGGAFGAPYYKIVIAGTERALAVGPEGTVQAVPSFTGAPEQLWRIDQLTDGTYRIMPKSSVGDKQPLALVALSRSTPALAKFDPASKAGRWTFQRP